MYVLGEISIYEFWKVENIIAGRTIESVKSEIVMLILTRIFSLKFLHNVHGMILSIKKMKKFIVITTRNEKRTGRKFLKKLAPVS